MDNEQEPKEFHYDPEWLAIVKTLDEYLSLQKTQKLLPAEHRIQDKIQENLAWVQENVMSKEGGLKVPGFVMTAPAYDPEGSNETIQTQYANPQTEHLCRLLDIKNPINPPS